MKIAIIGTHSVGKTTLVNELKKYIDLPVISEIARDFPRDIIDNPTNEMIRQMNIFESQIYAEFCYYENFISDRSTIDNAAYMIDALQKYGYNIPKKLFVNVVKHINKAINNSDYYDYLFYIPIEIPCVDDGFRNTDEVERKNIDIIIKSLLKNRIEITGTVKERVEKVLEIIKC